MANYCLVRGGWHGGWVWKRVARHLKEEGHDVYTPTMTGLGERSHLLNATINPTTADYCGGQGALWTAVRKAPRTFLDKDSGN